MSQNRSAKVFIFILVLTIFSLWIILPKNLNLKIPWFNRQTISLNLSHPTIDFSIGKKRIYRDLEFKYGLDLQGGAHIILEADMNKLAGEDREAALLAAKNVIEKRVNLFGISESIVQTSKTKDKYRIIVDLPGVVDVNKALELIGKTAQLTFKETEATASAQATPSAALFFPTKDTGLTGKDLKKASLTFDPQTGQPQVALQFNSTGAKKFAEITKRNVGKVVGIFLDNQPITVPKVNEPILSGQAVISGKFTLDEAKEMVIQLNAGALPVSLKVIEQQRIGPTLGQESVRRSAIAGLIGLASVMLFMWLYYGFPGFLANLSLILYGIYTLALYKLLPVTLTLPGVAGFMLSVGMAVDSNILIFERMKEELRAGQPWRSAMELGFGRAWDSIKDANVATLTTAFILFNPFNWSFLNASGMVRGFALTLALGILISLFTGIVVTRTLMRLFWHEAKNNKLPESQS
ncbi:MAG: protein translocase subunit SecD [bacterium]|nr:protein translocase subunit SecD [bacterium]